MNKTIIVAGIIIFGIVSWLTGFVNTLHEDVDVNYGFQEKVLVDGNSRNTVINSNGDEVLVLTQLSLQEQKKIWNSSILKDDMLELFPRFSDMRYFVENHIEDEGDFKEVLLSHIDMVASKYIGGSLSGQGAKVALSQF